jgi:hypothetical protein
MVGYYYKTMIGNLPYEEENLIQEYKDNILSIEVMRSIYEQQQKDWGCHTARDINLKRDEKTGLYYAEVDSIFHQGLLYNHLMIEQLYAQKEHVDWQRVTDGYDYREIEWIRHILTHPLVWVPAEEVGIECVVVGKVAREEEPISRVANDYDISIFCWRLNGSGALWFADNMPVLEDVHQVGRCEYDNLPEDMLLWDRLACGPLFKSYPINLRQNIDYIAEERGPAKAIELVERFREDWQDIITLKLFNMSDAEDYEVQRLHKAMFEEMDRKLRIWKRKVEEENHDKVPDISEAPKTRDYKLLVKWLEQEKKNGHDYYKEADNNRSEMCRKLTELLGWEVNENSLRKAGHSC